MPVHGRADHNRVGRLHRLQHLIELVVGEVGAVVVHLERGEIDLREIATLEERVAKVRGVTADLAAIDEQNAHGISLCCVTWCLCEYCMRALPVATPHSADYHMPNTHDHAADWSDAI